MVSLTIKQLIPQREPILMVDELLSVDGEQATTCFAIRTDNLFLGEDGSLEESGVIEHIAQSASAFAGYNAIMGGATEPPVGYIGEVKKFRCYHRPQVGERLLTTIELGPEVNGVTLLKAQTHVGDLKVAETQMKIFIQPDV